MRLAGKFLIVAVALIASAAEARAQGSAASDGYTHYTVIAEGVNVPPFPLKIEDGRLLSPEGSMIQVLESDLSGSPVTFVLGVPGATVRFLGQQSSDQFAGLMLVDLEDGSDRDYAPITILPVGSSPEIEPDPSSLATAPGIARVEVVPGNTTMTPGTPHRFVARAYDDQGREIPDVEADWYATGSGTRMSADGELRILQAGPKRVLAMVDGAIALADVTGLEPEIDEVRLEAPVPDRLAVGSRVPIEVDALNEFSRWVLNPEMTLTSSKPEVISIDGATIVARSPGTATVTISSGQARREIAIEVVRARAGEIAITGAPDGPVKTGDVVPLALDVPDARPIWSIAEPGAEIYPDGAFVAEEPGRYTVIALLDDRIARAEIVAESRGMAGRIRITGHGENLSTFTSDLWPQNRFVYVGTHQANQLRTYDVSEPSAPVLTDSLMFDARVINDVKVSEDGRWLVATREGAANRRNGILIFSLDDPAHPELVSEYTETLTAGVHNVFWVGSLVYAVNDGTGDLHIIDLSDPANPVEVGRWGLPNDGRSLHDVWVQDGIAFLSYLRDGLVILDVGGAGKGGTPTDPVEVSRIFYPGGPTHTAMRYGDYVFVGDEDFSLQGTVSQGNDPRGPIHVIDIRDIESPLYVAKYEVPEAGAHNIWIEDGVLYAGYYQGGIRAVDISGELRGDLYAQGREIAYFLPSAGPDDARQPNAARTWGVFPMFANGWTTAGAILFATDYNSGLWTFTVEMPERPIS